jgi:putative transposase
MSHTYSANFVHCVFSTKERALLIPHGRLEELWAYLLGIARNEKVKILAIGGVCDHLHLLISLPPKMNLSKVVCVKANSSKGMNESGVPFAWQEGFVEEVGNCI